MPSILITSFTTWKPEQPSNASNDLLTLAFQSGIPAHIHLLRQIPVDFQLAPATVIPAIQTLQPDWVLYCGMAENRTQLSLEAQATVAGKLQCATANWSQLLSGLHCTQISYDAGAFVCNYLYYAVLEFIEQQKQDCQCLFVHVPILTALNTAPILQDFHQLIQNLSVESRAL